MKTKRFLLVSSCMFVGILLVNVVPAQAAVNTLHYSGDFWRSCQTTGLLIMSGVMSIFGY